MLDQIRMLIRMGKAVIRWHLMLVIRDQLVQLMLVMVMMWQRLEVWVYGYVFH